MNKSIEGPRTCISEFVPAVRIRNDLRRALRLRLRVVVLDERVTRLLRVLLLLS